jgi:uncharacterized protein (DUF433 family)
MLDWSTCPAVETHPGKLGGTCVFRHSRVPVSSLFEHLESGGTVEEFVEWFPGVSRENVNAVLEHAMRSLSGQVPA